jgi:hypothetical protein
MNRLYISSIYGDKIELIRSTYKNIRKHGLLWISWAVGSTKKFMGFYFFFLLRWGGLRS